MENNKVIEGKKENKLNHFIDSEIEKEFPSIFEIFKQIHQNPELSGFEKETSALIAKELRSVGCEVHENIGGYGVIGIMKNGEGPVGVIRADMDALPLEENTQLDYASKKTQIILDNDEKVHIAHACGHDWHVSTALGVAKLLSKMKDKWKGTVVFVGQPSEELGTGAREMIAANVFEKFPDPNYILALHQLPDYPVGTIAYMEGFAMAGGLAFDLVVKGPGGHVIVPEKNNTEADKIKFDIIVKGPGGHGAFPEKTVDTVLLSDKISTEIRRRIAAIIKEEGGVLMINKFEGSSKDSVIPKKVTKSGTLQYFSEEKKDEIIQIMNNVCLEYAKIEPNLEEDLYPQIVTSKENEINFSGKGLSPEDIVDTVKLADEISLEMRERIAGLIKEDGGVLTINKLDGSTEDKTIPKAVSKRGTLRYFNKENRDEMFQIMNDTCLEYAKNEQNLDKSLYPQIILCDESEVSLPVLNEERFAKKVVSAFRTVFEEKSLVEIPALRASEDFSIFKHELPNIDSFMFYVGTSDPEKFNEDLTPKTKIHSLHSPKMIAQPEGMKVGMKAFLSAVLSFNKKETE